MRVFLLRFRQALRLSSFRKLPYYNTYYNLNVKYLRLDSGFRDFFLENRLRRILRKRKVWCGSVASTILGFQFSKTVYVEFYTNGCRVWCSSVASMNLCPRSKMRTRFFEPIIDFIFHTTRLAVRNRFSGFFIRSILAPESTSWRATRSINR